jgi:sugar-specific transcriptional regulator TrmB
MERVESLLRDFGLTEYEIRAFTTLLKLKIAAAEQISETGKIPLPRVYDTLNELKKKGFVLISKGRPKKFRIVSPKKALSNLIELEKEKFENKIKELKNKVEIISGILLELEPLTIKKEGGIWFTEKRKNVVKTLNEQLISAKKQVLSFAGDISWLSETISSIKEARKKGIEIKILAKELDDSKEFIKNVNRVKKLGVKIKTGYVGTLRGYIIDNKIASLALKVSEKGINIPEEGLPKSDIDRKYELIIIENPSVAVALKENFENWWNKLK